MRVAVGGNRGGFRGAQLALQSYAMPHCSNTVLQALGTLGGRARSEVGKFLAKKKFTFDDKYALFRGMKGGRP